MKYKIGELEVEATESLQEGKFLVQSEQSAFVISRDDFNKIATKVKEPKFKVGDVVYYISKECSFITKVRVERVGNSNGEEGYKLENMGFKWEWELFTLEEAIEKLKEL